MKTYTTEDFIQYDINSKIATLIYKSLKRNKKNEDWEKLVGYTLEDLRKHLEKQFRESMSWNNYGEWHLDHIIPKSLFRFIS